jgi:ankyrin repeat protein
MTNNYNNLVKKLCYFDNTIIQQKGGKKKSKELPKQEYDEEHLLELLSNKDWEKIIELYKNPRDIKINGNNLLHLACSRGEIEAINYYLLKYPELFYVANSEGDTCAHLLTKYSHYDILKKLLPKFPEAIHFLNKNGDNLLDLTIKEPQIMSWLINLLEPEYFTDMDASKIESLKSMIELIKLNKGQDLYLHLINKLLSKGYQLNIPSPYLPLVVASKLNRTAVTETFLKAGANPNIKDAFEMTPLIKAVENSSYESVKKLLEYGANINYAGPEGDNLPINFALENKDTEMVEILLNKKYGGSINFNYKDRNLETPIHKALKNQLESNFLKPSTLYKIIYESDLNQKNIKNTTPLHLLARYSNRDNLNNYSQIIKNKKLNLKIKDSENKTPLHYVSRENKSLFQDIKESSIVQDTKIIMPKLKNTNFSLFNSDILHNAIYTAMILRKYKNISIPKQKYELEKFAKEYDEYNFLANYKSVEGKLVKDIINVYFENFYSILPHLILWKSRDVHYSHPKLKSSVNKLLSKKNIDFIVIKLSLIPNANGTHANILIYDKKKNILERFEPFGPNEMIDEAELNNYIEKLAKKIFNKDVKFISPKLFMNETKFQLVSSDSDPDNKKTGDPIGYCMAWCFWYLELRLKNPNVPSEDLVKDAFNNILNKQESTSNQVLDYIRNYSQELDKMKNEFLKECKISKDKYYSSNFDEITMDKIITCLEKELN